MGGERKKGQSLRRMLLNNLFILRIAIKAAPLAVMHILVANPLMEVWVFIKHTLMVVYIIDCIQYQKPFASAAAFISVILIVGCIRKIRASFFEINIELKGKEKIYRAVRTLLYEKAKSVDMARYDAPDFYNDFVWAMNNADRRVDATINATANFLAAFVSVLVMGVYIVTQDTVSLIFVAVSFILSTVLHVKSVKLGFELEQALNPILRKRDYISRVFYLPDYAKEMRVNNVKGRLIEDYIETEQQVHAELRKKTHKIAWLEFLQSFLQETLIFDYLYLLYLMFLTIVKQSIGFGALVGLYRSSQDMKGSISSFSTVLSAFQENSLYIEKMRGFLACEPVVVLKPEAKPAKNGTLELKNVSFAYPGTQEASLTDISLTIRPGEKVAFVGYNGAGKTTLVKLIMRLYDVTSGEICCAGEDVRDYDVARYRDLFAVVFQDYQIYAASLSENVVTGDETPDEARLARAIDASGFAERVAKMPMGLDTQLTREFMPGEDLSGGEKQKLAISRSLYKDSPILILDEPSSALDPVTEYELNNFVMELGSDKTVIIISHRLSTTKMADRIYMFEMGRLVEQGSHTELMALGGKYAEMFTVQAEKYRSIAGVEK